MRIQRVLAPNPGLFTGPGTNTYLIEDGGEAVILDPGPIEATHRQAIIATVGDLSVRAVIVTHTHPDHAPLANPLARWFEVPALGYEPGPQFQPDHRLTNGEVIKVGAAALEAIHTPGHTDDHLCFRSGDVLFTGDHIMGGSSVIITDAGSYMDSLQRLARLKLSRLYPGHGEQIERPTEVISWYIAHRQERERQILAAVASGCGTVGEIVEQVYRQVDQALHALAVYSVAAHLKKLAAEGAVWYGGQTRREAPVELREGP